MKIVFDMIPGMMVGIEFQDGFMVLDLAIIRILVFSRSGWEYHTQDVDE